MKNNITEWQRLGKRSRRKGHDYERKICKFLSDITGVKFRRAPRSGAMIRDGMINGTFLSGDLLSEKNFVFSIECKNRKKISLCGAIKNQQHSELIKGWHQCVYDAQISNKRPMMFFYLCNDKCDLVAVDDDGKRVLVEAGLCHNTPTISISIEEEITHTIGNEQVRLKLPNMNVMPLKGLQKIANYDRLFT